ncbi:MAG TPA: GNAT family N-acetyltransferase [Candidatus Limnocylindrales bacterium]|nr:GNAT family N-acetyltransferase [Candidatus Limnocylindrales bacterium]
MSPKPTKAGPERGPERRAGRRPGRRTAKPTKAPGPTVAGPRAVEAVDVVLRDGASVILRPARPEDEASILAFLEGLSRDALWMRFAGYAGDLAAAARTWAQLPDADSLSLLAVSGFDERIVAQASYQRTAPQTAEVAFAVADERQGQGLATHLLRRLASVATEQGILSFEAQVVAHNHRMLLVFRESGFPATLEARAGLVRVTMPTALTEDGLARFEHRDELAAAAAVRQLLTPRSVAVIGASRRRGTIGGEIFRGLLVGDFAGPVYPVNPAAPVVQSVAAYPGVEDVPGPVDLAVLVVPAAAVVEAAEACARKGVRSLVVISAGFAELGQEGAQRQAELLAVCRRAGMRLVGPNCLGVVNTAPEVRLTATFSPTKPVRGRVGFLSQSGALGLAAIDYANDLGLGLSSFVSVGNKADLSGNDFLDYWEADEATALIVLYLESLGNPRRFARIARRVGRQKPIVVVKGGRTAAGARATSSHTGALLGQSDVTVDALFRQAGVIRTDTLGELFDVATLLANQPVPAGRRVAILTNGGGPGILCADACEAAGLEVPPLPEATRDRLAAFLPPEAGLRNPVDMIAGATADDYRRAIGILAAEPGIDALVCIFVPPLVTRADDVAAAIRTAAGELPRPIPLLSVFMSAHGVPEALRGDGVRIPSYAFPEDAAAALARAADYGAWRQEPEGTIPTLSGVRATEATAVVADALAAAEGGDGWLDQATVAALLGCYGLPLAEQQVVPDVLAAGRAAARIGGPVALKAIAPGLVHKTDAGAVRLSLTGARAVRHAAAELADHLAGSGIAVQGYLVQEMVTNGLELLVGVVHDRLFGPVVACAAGGVNAELLKDVAVRITPLTDRDAQGMVRSLATFPLLDGYRGAPKRDVAALEDVLLRVSAMVEAHPEIAEMDLNPLMLRERGALIVDARIRIAAPVPR